MHLKTIILLAFLLGIGCSAGSAKVHQDSLLWEQARRLYESAEYDSAYTAYDKLYNYQDSLYRNLYSQKIEAMRDTYQLEELELENKRQLNSLYLKTAISLAALFLLGTLCWVCLKRSSLMLSRSKEEMENAKELAEMSKRNKSLFLSNMSHEIRTPLNALVGFSDILATEGIDDVLREQCNDIIQLNSELLLKLVNDVVDISCFDVGRMKFDIRPADAVALCRSVLDTVDKVKHNSDAVLTFETEFESLVLATDVHRLQQVLINILVNATKFTPHGSIVLKLERKDGAACFSVTDTGCGIQEEKRSKIFNRFEKLDEKAQGFGLGLSICELIVKRLGGTIWIDADYREGARFLFTHPIMQEESR